MKERTSFGENDADAPKTACASAADLVTIEAPRCRFFRSPGGSLRLTLDEHVSYPHVLLRRLFPVRHPDRFIQLAADAGHEIGILLDAKRLDRESLRHVEDELDFYYAVPQLRRIDAITFEYGFSFWETQTDRGPRCFYVKGRSESVKTLDRTRVFVTDIDDCRYEIPDIDALPRDSRAELDQML